MCEKLLTLMFEKIVPNAKNSDVVSTFKMSFREKVTQMVAIINSATKGKSGRTASVNGLIFPLRFLYDL